MFWHEYSNGDAKKKQEMIQTVHKVEGYTSDRFMDKLEELIKGNNIKEIKNSNEREEGEEVNTQ